MVTQVAYILSPDKHELRFHFNDVETSKLLPMMDVDGELLRNVQILQTSTDVL